MNQHTTELDAPTTHDCHTDAYVRSSVMPEQDADAFPADEPMSDEELERLCEAEQARRAARTHHRVCVTDRTACGYYATLTLDNGEGDTFTLHDLASVFAQSTPGSFGWLFKDAVGQWEFLRDRTAADDAADAFIAECDAYEAQKQAEKAAKELTTRAITNRPVRLDPAAWGQTA